MFIKIHRATQVPIYLQIEERVRSLIADGVLRAGDRLPSTRQLAATLGLNRMTVEAAFSKLEADGLITSQVGRGTFVNRTTASAQCRVAAQQLDPEALGRLWGPLLKDLRSVSTPVVTAGPR